MHAFRDGKIKAAIVLQICYAGEIMLLRLHVLRYAYHAQAR